MVLKKMFSITNRKNPTTQSGSVIWNSAMVSGFQVRSVRSIVLFTVCSCTCLIFCISCNLLVVLLCSFLSFVFYRMGAANLLYDMCHPCSVINILLPKNSYALMLIKISSSFFDSISNFLVKFVFGT